MARSRRCIQAGDGPFFTPRKYAPDEERTGLVVGVVEAQLDLDRALEASDRRRRVERLQPADPLRREVAGDAVDAERIGAVRRDGDVDHRIVESDPRGVGCSDRRVGGKVDDPLVVVGEAQLALRQEHAVRRLAADRARLQIDAGAGDVRSGGCEDTLHAGAGIRRAADDLDRHAVAGIDEADAQPVGVRVLLRLNDAGDDERLQRLRRIVDRFDLKPEMRQRLGDLLRRRVGFEVVLQPGEREFH